MTTSEHTAIHPRESLAHMLQAACSGERIFHLPSSELMAHHPSSIKCRRCQWNPEDSLKFLVARVMSLALMALEGHGWNCLGRARSWFERLLFLTNTLQTNSVNSRRIQKSDWVNKNQCGFLATREGYGTIFQQEKRLEIKTVNHFLCNQFVSTNTALVLSFQALPLGGMKLPWPATVRGKGRGREQFGD